MQNYNYQPRNQYPQRPQYDDRPYYDDRYDDNYRQQYQRGFLDYSQEYPKEYPKEYYPNPYPDNRYQDVKPFYEDDAQYQVSPNYQTKPLQGQSRLDRAVYMKDLSPTKYDDLTYLPPFTQHSNEPDWNSPANKPYIPYQDKSTILDQEVADFIQNLPKYTKHPEEIEFARYVSESILIDSYLGPKQNQLIKDFRFNSRLLFEYFDAKQVGQLDFMEFKWSLNKLDIHFKNDDCYGLFCRVASEDQKISHTEFHELLIGFNDLSQNFNQFGANHYMHQNKKQQQQYFTILQRDLIDEIIQFQLRIEQNLTQLRHIIGQDEQTLMALFRQMDGRGKGYLVIEDIQNYLQDLGGDFSSQDFNSIFNRISKVRSSRINFNEFKREFHIDTQHELRRIQALTMSPNKRQQDYIEILHQNQQETQRQRQQEQQQREQEQRDHQQQQRDLQQQQAQQQQTKVPPHSPHKLITDHSQFPIYKDDNQAAPQEQPLQNDYSFPGFTRYQLKRPQAYSKEEY